MRPLALVIMALAVSGALLQPSEAGAIPRANGQIAFTSERDGNQEIYVMNADGSGQTRLTNDPDTDSNPAWSPDGTKIAFQTTRHITYPCQACNAELYVINADGTNETRLTEDPGTDRWPAWSTDGTRIAFISVRGEADPACSLCHLDLYVMNGDGTGLRNLTGGFDAVEGRTSTGFAWSPDGTKLAFETTANGDLSSEIYTVNVDGTGLTNLTNDPADDIHPVWSPDGGTIAFDSTRNNNLDIYAMSSAGGPATRLTEGSVDLHLWWRRLKNGSIPLSRLKGFLL